VVNTTSKLMFYLLHDGNPNFLMKLLAFRLLEEFLLLMELQFPLPYSQESISGHHLKPGYFSPQNPTFFLYYTFNIIISDTFNSFRCFLFFRFGQKRCIFIFKLKNLSCIPYFHLTTLHRPGQNILVFY